MWTVSALIREVNSLLDQGFSGIRVEGEVTNASASGRGHLYFTLKDEGASLDCVMWSSRAQRLRFTVEDGLAAIAGGSLTIYPQRGRFQLVVEELEPRGVGALQLAFEQLKKRLAAEGLFAPERKRPLPLLPQRVGVVTSLAGAALRDMLKVLKRCPYVEVVAAQAAVQGAGAAAEIAAALTRLGGSGLVDVIIVGRGGGSLEDLWAFNEEPVARAIAACPVPVISAVGHEVDFSIADFVADVRAATPTQGAEIVVARVEEQVRRMEQAEKGLGRDLQRHLYLARTRLAGLAGSSGLARVPQRIQLLAARLDRADRVREVMAVRLERLRQRCERASSSLRRLPARVAAGGHRRVVEGLRQQLEQIVKARMRARRAAVGAAERALTHLGPHKVLERGYSITTVDDDPSPVRDAGAVRAGQTLHTRLARGVLRSLVTPDGPGHKQRRSKDGGRQTSLFDD